MSLISDALKTAQRERAKSQGPRNQQQGVEGFFPYAASTPVRARSRRGPIVVIGAAVVVLLAVTGWLAWPRLAKPAKPLTPPIILPPPVTVTQSPSHVDSIPAGAAVTQAENSGPRQTSAPRSATTSTQPVVEPTRSKQFDAKSADRQIEPAVPATRAADRHEPIPETPVRRETTPRVDYEGQATALFNAGDLAGARDRFQLATRYSPTARAWTNYGVTLQRLGDNVGASAAYQSAIGMDANYLEAWLYQGRLAAELGDVARAVPLFQRARAINPRNPDVNVELARLEYEAKNWTEARRFAEEAVRTDPANTRGHWYIGASSDQLKDVEGAIRGYTAYLQYVGDAQRDQAVFVGWARTRLAELKGKP